MSRSRAQRLHFPLVLGGTFLLATGLWLANRGAQKPDAAASSESHDADSGPSFSQLAEVVQPAVVSLSTVRDAEEAAEDRFYYGDPERFFREYLERRTPKKRGAFSPRQRVREGIGSGVIVDPSGYILTNAHVVDGVDHVTVTLWNEKTYDARVVGVDDRTDVAVLKIRTAGALPFVPLGQSAPLVSGDWIVAFGSPFDLQQTVTAGIISAKRQSLMIEGRNYRDILQTDAAINRGNSGGPLVNVRGEVVGLNTAIYGPTGVFSGVGFAIPIDQIKPILRDLIEKGRVDRSWIGVEVLDVDEAVAAQFGMAQARGCLVNQVFEDSPAADAGVVRGDILLEYGDRPLSSGLDLQDAVAASPAGEKKPLKIFREGQELMLSIEPEPLPETDLKNFEGGGLARSTEWLGAVFSDITQEAREKFNLSSEVPAGVVVIDVPAESEAAEAGLIVGDVLLAVNNSTVRDTARLKKVIREYDPKKGVVFDLWRDGKSLFLSWRPARP